MPIKLRNTTGELNTKDPKWARKYPKSELIITADVRVAPGESVDVTSLLGERLIADKIKYFTNVGIAELVETRVPSAAKQSEKKEASVPSEVKPPARKKPSRPKRSRKKSE